ncbi:MAG: hypothetical protein ACREVA_03520 [Burkholderiales bacterium]
MTANTSTFTGYETNNLLVPAYGNTRTVKTIMPDGGPYSLQTRQVLFDLVPFIAQAVTVDSRAVVLAGAAILQFKVSEILYIRNLTVGSQAIVTFNFPSPKDAEYSFVTNDGSVFTGPIISFFYNFPSFNF